MRGCYVIAQGEESTKISDRGVQRGLDSLGLMGEESSFRLSRTDWELLARKPRMKEAREGRSNLGEYGKIH